MATRMVKAVETECMECKNGCTKGHKIEYLVAKKGFLINGGSHQADNFRSVLLLHQPFASRVEDNDIYIKEVSHSTGAKVTNLRARD